MNPVPSPPGQQPITRRAALAGTAAALIGPAATVRASVADMPARVLVVVGPSNHPPGTHEVAAGGRVLKHCLNAVEKPGRLKAEVSPSGPPTATRRSRTSPP